MIILVESQLLLQVSPTHIDESVRFNTGQSDMFNRTLKDKVLVFNWPQSQRNALLTPLTEPHHSAHDNAWHQHREHHRLLFQWDIMWC